MRRAHSTRRRFHGALAIGVALGVVSAGQAHGAAPPRAAAQARVWDEGHQLSSQAREDLERRLIAAERTSGAPIFLLVTDRVHGDSMSAVTATAFAAHGLGIDPARNAVLLAVAVRSAAAAVETGKGNAGIVPEVDARRIAKQLAARVSPRHPETAIGMAITALAASAGATAARRTALPRDALDGAGQPDEVPAPAVEKAATAADVAAAIDAGVLGPDAAAPEEVLAVLRALADAGADGGVLPGDPSSTAAERRRRSRLPFAVAIAALVLVGLGLRRRKQITGTRPPPKDDRPRRF